MNFAWQYNHLVIPLLLSIVITVGLLAIAVRRRKTFVVTAFVGFMVSVFFWITGSLLELVTLNLRWSLWFADLSFLGITFFPICWFAFALYYSGKAQLFQRILPYLLVIPVVTNILIWTNSFHHLWRIGAVRDLTTTWFPITIYDYGIWFNAVHVTYSLSLAFIANLLHIRALFMHNTANRINIMMTMFACNLPLLLEVLHLLGIQPIQHFNVSILVFPISGLTLAYVALRLQILELIPIARSQVVENMQDIMLVVSDDGRIIDLNTSAKETLFAGRQRVLGSNLKQLINPELAEQLITSDDKYEEIVLTKVDGQQLTFELRRSKMTAHLSDNDAYLIIMHDITARKQAELNYHQQVKQVAILEERQRLARELHDSVNQTLFATGALADLLPLAIDKKPEKVSDYVTDIRELISGTTSQLRLILMELYPDALVETDIYTLLDHLGRAFTGSTGIPVKFQCSMTIKLEDEVKVAFYRITQEALHNINKHTQASQVNICLEQTNTFIKLTIKDDGQGFDTQSVKGGHFGLDNMRERAFAIDATLSVDSVIGQGTCISLCLNRVEGAGVSSTLE